MVHYTATIQPSAAESLAVNLIALRMILFALILSSFSSTLIFSVLRLIEINVILTIQTESYLLAHDIEPVQQQYSRRKIIIIVVTSLLALFKVGTFVIVYIKGKLLIKLWSILVLISCFGHIAISDFDSLVFEIATFAMIVIFICIDRKKVKFGLKSLTF